MQSNNLKTRTATNAKISVSFICVEAIIYLLLYTWHNWTFNPTYHLAQRQSEFYVIFYQITLSNIHAMYVSQLHNLFVTMQ